MYLYSAYAPQLATQLKFTVTQTSTIGLIGNLGTALTGPGSGSLVDSQGPSIAIAIGAALILLGYNIVREVYSYSISSFPIIAGALLCVGAGSTFVLSAIVKCAAVNYPSVQGVATSIPMAAYGLSAFILAWLSSLIFPGDTYGILLILSVVPAGLFLFSFFFVKLLPHDEYESLQTTEVHSRSTSVEVIEMAQLRHSTIESVVHNTKPHIDIHGKKLLTSPLFWSHFVIMGILAGVGQMYIYSCGYIVKALLIFEYKVSTLPSNTADDIEKFLAIVHQIQSVHVGIISLSSFTGRIFSGTFSDFLVNRLHTQRDWILVGAGVICTLAQICGLFISSSKYLWFISATTGLMYGMCFGSYPMIIGDAFGMNHFTENWGIVTLSPIPTAYAFNWLFGKFFDNNSIVDDTGNRECVLGIACYIDAYKITLGASVILLIATAIVIYKHRHYRSS